MDKHKKSVSSDRTPFLDRVNVKLFFSGAQRRKLLDEVKRTLEKGAAVVTVTGEEGVGKSMICRMVEKELPAETFSVYLPTPLESFDDVIRVLALEVGTDNADKPVSSKILVDEIAAELEIRERRLVVVFDQSERMYLATIERIRKMLDKINENTVLLQIVFAGRPSLLENLKQLAICNFKDVEERHFSLHPLGLSETYAYLNHCAQQRSSSRSKNVFTPEAAKKIYSMAQGNLRMTNMLAAKSLEAANTDTSFMVLLDNVGDEDQESSTKKGGKTPVASWRGTSRRRWAYGGLGLLALVAVVFFLFDDDGRQNGAGDADIVVGPGAEQVVPLPAENAEEDTAPEPAESSVNGKAAATEDPPVDDTMAEPSVAGNEEREPAATTAASGGGKTRPAPEDQQSAAVVAADESVEKAPKEPAAAKDEVVVGGGLSTVESHEPPTVPSPQEIAGREAEVGAVADVLEEPSAASGQPVHSTPTAGTESAAGEEYGQIVLDSAVKLRQDGDADRTQAEEIAQSGEGGKSEEPLEKGQGPLPEDRFQEPDYGEPVVFVGMKKRLPPPETDEGSAKKIVKIAPAKVKIPVAASSEGEPAAAVPEGDSVDEIFNRSLDRGGQWLQGRNQGSHTVQLMALTAEQAEDNLKNRFRQREYRRIADQLYIVKGDSPTVYVYYGEYEDMDAARQARNSLPVFLLKHDPYAVSVEEAIAKAVSGR